MTDERGVLRALPVTRRGSVAVARACKRPLCGQQIDRPVGRSRPRDFCSDACRILYHQERKQVRSALLEAQRLAAQYEVEVAGDQTGRVQPSPAYLGAQLNLPPPGEVVLGLIAQALDQIRLDLQDGVQVRRGRVYVAVGSGKTAR